MVQRASVSSRTSAPGSEKQATSPVQQAHPRTLTSQLLQMQQMYGNQAVSQMMKSYGSQNAQPIQRVTSYHQFAQTSRIGTKPAKILLDYWALLVRISQAMMAKSAKVPSVFSQAKVASITIQSNYVPKVLTPTDTLSPEQVKEYRQALEDLWSQLEYLEPDVDEAEAGTYAPPEPVDQIDPEKSPAVNNNKPTLKLYRKMHASEAQSIKQNGLPKAMTFNTSDSYKKYFTTSLSHTQEFQNANSTDASNEVVMEFVVDWDSYWKYVSDFAKPNQKTGVMSDRNSAIMNQERLVKGPRANFLVQDQVDQVHSAKEHHNIGVGQGNVADFNKFIISQRVMDVSEWQTAD
ncbi:hypothetical protein JJB07_21795 [Tumebacillus sp. ITR2]|uniref:Uncharacterized protein n=1 Tax=Tumebacillus amylolyticus TaxID=2801339 RepID=A0ABS1JG10_9BACL|nr:hypothetical protein [Tumebacillus amylolyticus]MBL0389230.1 hypothetical protein [Tumebacillus amylolyticus]